MRISHVLGFASACACLLAALPATSHAVLTSPETLLLDTHSPSETAKVTGAVSTTQPLAPGAFYVIRATGTFSRYVPELMVPGAFPKRCGTPEAAPLFPSPGLSDSQVGVGIDPEWAFSYFMKPASTPCPTPAVRPIGAFQISTGGPYSHVVATNRGSGPRPDHTYNYVVEGSGAPVSFLYEDFPLHDNNGVISITVSPAAVSDCAGNAACVTSVETGVTPSATTAAATGPSLISTTARTCASKRRFRIRLVDRKADPIRSATVRVNGKTVKVETAKLGGRTRRISHIDLRGLPSNRFTVSITAKTKSGKVLRGSRRYFTCKPKLKGGKPKL